MTTKKPSTVTSALGAYAYKSGVSSTATNYIDNTFPNLLDKTGDNATNGGGISGRIDVLSGGEIKVASGGQLDVSSGGTFTINSGVTANLTIGSGASITIASGGAFTVASGSTASLTGATYDAVHYQLTSYNSSPQTLSATTGVIILVDTTSVAISITLPASQNGRVFKFKDIGGNASTNPITIKQPGSEKIEGLASVNYVMNANFECIELTADASSNWWITGAY